MELQLALIYSRSGEWEKSLEVTKSLLAERPAEDQPEIAHLHAEVLSRNGNSDQALTFLEKLPNDFPTADRVKAQKAQILFDLGKDRAAGLMPIGSAVNACWVN